MSKLCKHLAPVILAVISLFFCNLTTQADGPDSLKAVTQFARDFYQWYGTISHKNNKLSPDQRAIKEKPQMFSAELITALKEDYLESSKHPEEIVGLDWDPFLFSQDLDDRYEIGTVKQEGQNFLVEVYGVNKKKKNPEPNVVAEVASQNGHLIFVNFHAPGGGDLLHDLRDLKNEREKAGTD